METETFGRKIQIEDELIRQPEEEIRIQLKEYLEGARRSFELEIRYPNSFTGEVMEQMKKIPYGETMTYGQLAEKLETSPIAVGQACGNNPIPVIVPCHRVVSENGTGGYGYGKKLKTKLLELEKSS